MTTAIYFVSLNQRTGDAEVIDRRFPEESTMFRASEYANAFYKAQDLCIKLNAAADLETAGPFPIAE